MKRTWSAPFAREVDESVELVLDTAQQERVDLDGLEPGLESGVDAGQRGGEVAAARDAPVARRVEAVDADIDPAQTRVAQLGGEARQQDAVRRQGDVVDAGRRRELRDEPGAALAHEWLAAGHAHFADAGLHRHAGKGDDLLVAQDLTVCALGHTVRWHAVRAAEVAAIGYREAQVIDAPCLGLGAGHRSPGRAVSVPRPGTACIASSS